MRSVKITQHDGGLFTVETSDGNRGAGASLRSAAEKLVPAAEDKATAGDLIVWAFEATTDKPSGQIVSGQASG